jgi:type VI secretion system protein ImpF
MMELQANNRLQPCLLHRLTDDDPSSRVESRSERVVSLSRYKESVLRDLRWLFNSSAHIQGDPIHDDPLIKTSVLNFGVRDLSGLVSDSIDLEQYRRQIIESLLAFEPRLNRHKLEVKFVDFDGAGSSTHRAGTLRFEVSGELFARPMPERFLARTEIDLETGECFLV